MAIAPSKLILSICIYQFDASENFNALAFGPPYKKAPFPLSLSMSRMTSFVSIKSSISFKMLLDMLVKCSSRPRKVKWRFKITLLEVLLTPRFF
jgi:hypothetical protein